ncbi:MAG: citrate lyase holo-[acyl-carrier protein] synthase, partial [Defluviitaleaceae bacterium]|nr:citrate lyase holo-[acyl-carrier protein] synthase [Defluviitaleaceae bacterium]
MNVTVYDMMDARDRRVKLQHETLAKHNCPIVSYTLNIAGNIKRFAHADRCFYEGKLEVEELLHRESYTILESALTEAKTGIECIWAVDADALRLKHILSAIEESHPLGRLFDIDVISGNGTKVSRHELGLPERACLVCGSIGKACARSRAHPFSEVIERTHSVINGYFSKKDVQLISKNAVRALLYELAATPKPGLVDRNNSGAHKDMHFLTFIDSTVAISNYFSDMAEAGMRHKGLEPSELLLKLRKRGITAEYEMFKATRGVNTHKG